MVVVGKDDALEKDYEEEIVAHCIEQEIPFVRRADFSGITTAYAMAVSWRWMIQHPPDRLIVFHDSLLPKYRGFAPLPNALINGEKRLGVTALYGAEDYDTGDLIAQSAVEINYPLKIVDAIGLVINCYVDVAASVLVRLADGQPLPAQPQNHEEATYSVWRNEEDYAIDWTRSAAEIRRFIDAVGFPYPGATARVDQHLVRIHDAEEIPDLKIENRDPGKVLFVREGSPVVICGQGLLEITRCSLNGADFLPLKKFRTRFR
jgi:methionyl-tRNA formyltransferase